MCNDRAQKVSFVDALLTGHIVVNRQSKRCTTGNVSGWDLGRIEKERPPEAGRQTGGKNHEEVTMKLF